MFITPVPVDPPTPEALRFAEARRAYDAALEALAEAEAELVAAHAALDSAGQ